MEQIYYLEPFITTKYNNEEREKIKSKINEIQKMSDVKSIGLQFEKKENEINDTLLVHAEEMLNVYEHLSLLGIYVMNSYRFFSNLIVKNAFECPFYNCAMRKLGYQPDGNLWFLKSEPDQEAVIDLIYTYCFYAYAVESKKLNETAKIEPIDAQDDKVKNNDCENDEPDSNNSTMPGLLAFPVREEDQDCEQSDNINDENNEIKEEKNEHKDQKEFNRPFKIDFSKIRDRAKMQFRPIKDLMRRKNKVVQDDVWICQKCTFKNNLRKTCKCCKEKKFYKEIDPNIWDCWNCKKENYLNLKFCGHCHLSKHGNRQFGNEVERQVGDKIEMVWLCHSCHQINDVNKDKCSRKDCKHFRYNP